MKKAALLLVAVLLLTGCSSGAKEMERAIQLRTKLLTASNCSFDTQITADYGTTLHRFTLHCEADQAGRISFSVTKPDSISGIAGVLDADSGGFTFGDTALHFPLLADDQLSPISAPWLLMKTLRSGCITSVGTAGESLRLSIDDSYADDALHLDILLDPNDLPVQVQLLYREHKILSMDVTNFRME